MVSARKFVEAPIEWFVPEHIVSRQATHLVVQHHEDTFYVSYFEIWPPILIGTPEEIEKQLKKAKTIRAECVARITISATAMPNFIKAMETNYESYLSTFKEMKVEEDEQPVSSV